MAMVTLSMFFVPFENLVGISESLSSRPFHSPNYIRERHKYMMTDSDFSDDLGRQEGNAVLKTLTGPGIGPLDDLCSGKINRRLGG